jgi:hypothetical protein
MGAVMSSWQWRTLFSLSAVCLLFTNALAADPVLTERDAQSMMDKKLFEGWNCGAHIPVGEYNFKLIETAKGGGKHDLVALLNALNCNQSAI